MNYEVSREIFKQRLNNRLNFVLVDLSGADNLVKFDNVEKFSVNDNFKQEFAAKFSNKSQNILLYSLSSNGNELKNAAEQLAEVGYEFVYYYQGTTDDVVLDKGLN